MKASEYIKRLEILVKEHGDLDLVYAKDDEGNAFLPVNYFPGPGHYIAKENDFHDIDYDEDGTFEINALCIN